MQYVKLSPKTTRSTKNDKNPACRKRTWHSHCRHSWSLILLAMSVYSKFLLSYVFCWFIDSLSHSFPTLFSYEKILYTIKIMQYQRRNSLHPLNWLGRQQQRCLLQGTTIMLSPLSKYLKHITFNSLDHLCYVQIV